jgi:GH25 family lysozyme M1 (1,4-beta-N-acetylmuramidase)
MIGHTQGLDSRYFNGKRETAYPFEFIYSKLTDGDSGLANTCLVQTAWARRLEVPQGYYHFYRYALNGARIDPIRQAQWYFDNLSIMPCQLPPVLDFEDRYAPKGPILVKHMDEFGSEIVRLGLKPMIYTAPWWWDSWVKPWDGKFAKFHPYDWDLWEADPPPNTPSPGRWMDYEVVQYKLDTGHEGFNASIDIDYARELWFRQYVP